MKEVTLHTKNMIIPMNGVEIAVLPASGPDRLSVIHEPRPLTTDEHMRKSALIRRIK